MGLSAKTCVPCHSGGPELARDRAEALLGEVPGWKMGDDGKRIARTIRFRDFAGALRFAVRVGEIAEAEGHHPELTVGWGACTVVFWTHAVGGLHENDFVMAAKVNEIVE